jgi:hypothetical protein
MIKEELLKLLEEFQCEMFDTLNSKGHDYANEDVLSNFKEVSQLVGVTPETVVMVMIVVKIVRLSNLLKNSKTPKNESVKDNLLDLTNYTFLLNAIINERNKSEGLHI